MWRFHVPESHACLCSLGTDGGPCSPSRVKCAQWAATYQPGSFSLSEREKTDGEEFILGVLTSSTCYNLITGAIKITHNPIT